MSKSLYLTAFKIYYRVHRKVHRSIESRIYPKLFDGLHACNVFNYNNEFFLNSVESSDVVVDIGCGTGKLLHSLALRIKKGIGIENDPRNLQFCKTVHAAENLVYIEADLFNVDYQELFIREQYTTACYSHILEHLADPAALLRTVGADTILISVPSEENWPAQTAKHFCLPYSTDPTHYREYTRALLAEHVNSGGYKVEFIGFNPEGHIFCQAKKLRVPENK